MTREIGLTLTPFDRRVVADTCRRLSRYDRVSQAEDFVLEAQVQAARLSAELRRALITFRRFGHPSGGLLVRGVPIGTPPPTPERADALIGASGSGAAAMSVLVAALGDQYGFRPELGGNIVQDILPVSGFEELQISVSSRANLKAHTETAFSPYHPDWVALLCLRQDAERQATTTLSSIDAMLPLLDSATIAVLRQPRFRTKVDPSFLLGDNLTEDVWIDPICVFSGGSPRLPQVRVDFADTEGKDATAQKALDTLRDAAIHTQTGLRLEAGEMLVVDNTRAVHGRTTFTPRYDGSDRWLLRSFVTRDLRRSEAVRPGDSRIVEPDYAYYSSVV